MSTPPIKRVVTIFEGENEIFLHHGTSDNFQSLLLKPERENEIKRSLKNSKGTLGTKYFMFEGMRFLKIFMNLVVSK